MLRYFVAMVALLTWIPHQGFAQTDPPDAPVDPEADEIARIHFQAGLSYYEQGRYDDAFREFSESYRLSGRPELLVSMASAEERRLNFTEAIALLEQFIAIAPERQDIVTGRLEYLRRLQTEVSSPQDHGSSTEPNPTTEQPPQSSPSRTLPIVFTTAGGALLATALATGLVAHSTHGSISESCVGGQFCDRAALEEAQQGYRLARASTALTFVGAAATITGLILFLVRRPSDESVAPETPAIALSFGVQHATVHFSTEWP